MKFFILNEAFYILRNELIVNFYLLSISFQSLSSFRENIIKLEDFLQKGSNTSTRGIDTVNSMLKDNKKN